MKDTKKKIRHSKKKPPLGTNRNPWHKVRGQDNRFRYFRFTPYGIWMVQKPPDKAIIIRDTDDGN
jgi:hypothetical protein